MRIGGSSLSQAATDLSGRYRNPRPTTERFIVTGLECVAYAAVRMPATFSAVGAVLEEVERAAPDLKIESVLDLGAGTGAATWAAAEHFESLRQITLIEQDGRLIELGRKLALSSEHQALRAAEWRMNNLRGGAEFEPHDLVVCSYALGEIEASTASRIMRAAWLAASQALVLVEPGTMKGFATIRMARDQLIEAGGFLLAPCPHQQACPMTTPGAGNDWCHFSARFERSALHRRLKSGTLGYEDEKFSYVAATKRPFQRASARVIRHPLRHAGYTQLQLCTPAGLQSATITKRDRDAWKRARKTNWGDGWANDPVE